MCADDAVSLCVDDSFVMCADDLLTTWFLPREDEFSPRSVPGFPEILAFQKIENVSQL